MGCDFRLSFSILLGLLTMVGCQNWSAMTSGIPLQNPSRVPPPATGSYPASTGYYNNANSGLPTTQTTYQAKGESPSTSASLSNSNVVRASWQSDPAPAPTGTNRSASASRPASAIRSSKAFSSASASLSDSNDQANSLPANSPPGSASSFRKPPRSEFTAPNSPAMPSVPSTASLSDATNDADTPLNWQVPR